MISSMTGFARLEGAYEDWRWVWEIRSVNGRNLEVRCRLPHGYDALEIDLRKAAKEKLSRGNVSISLTLHEPQNQVRYKINEAALKTVIERVSEIRESVYCTPSRPEGILALRGVMEPFESADESEADRQALGAALLASFGDGLDDLIASRQKEGASLIDILETQLAETERLVSDASDCAAAASQAIKEKLSVQINDMLADMKIPEERLAQEAALLAIKADVREELDRLNAHLEAGRAMLQKPEPVGRRLDFLIQEFNREANTLCSKAADMQLKRIGLDLKNVIDQMREQVQNIE